MVKSDLGTGKCSPHLRLILNCFQEGLTEVGNWKHLPGTTIEEDQQRDRVTSSETNHRKSALELVVTTENMSRYERVFRSLETDGISVKLSNIPSDAAGLS
jgi:hypothetical protein